MKRPHLEVNLGELDQLLDQATSAPMAASDSAKVKTALHAMAERLLAVRRSSEKTRNVVPPSEPEAPPPAGRTSRRSAAEARPWPDSRLGLDPAPLSRSHRLIAAGQIAAGTALRLGPPGIPRHTTAGSKPFPPNCYPGIVPAFSPRP